MSTIEKALAKQKQAEQDRKKGIEAPLPSSPQQNDDVMTAKSDAKDVFTQQTSNKEEIILNGDSLNRRGFIYSPKSAHHIQEEFRHIKRKLLNNAFGPASKTLKNSNLIMVSSSSPNEGKTFISINLALSIALEQDKTVLLIDADVLRPSLHRELEFESKQGLLEYLLDEVPSLSDVIYNTSIANLKLIPSGKPHHLTNELLASTKMATLAEELAKRYPDRIVIFDSPPVLATTQAEVLAGLVGQVVLVIEAEMTLQSMVSESIEKLKVCDVVLALLNKSTHSFDSEYYGYGQYGH